jgi:predicted lipoprotein with Yx(FWY)xxD motif
VGSRALRFLAVCAVGAIGVGVAFAVMAPILKSSKVARLGSIVVNGKGLTVYHASSEKNGKVVCRGNCLYFWFPVLAGKGKVVLGKGLSRAKLGTTKRPNGALQVTYNGFPLYRYYRDRKPGQFRGQGVKDPAGKWYVVSTSGKVVTTPAPTTTGTGGTTGTSTGSTTTVIGY